ncbi:MAG: DUF3379 family protein [Gammaproteobacteria bacterium]
MLCEDFRKTLDVDPGADFPGRAAHAAACDDCARYAAEAAVFERKLAAALAIDVPDLDIRLPDDPEESDVVSLDDRRAARRGTGTRWRGLPAWAGIAAALVLGIALVLGPGGAPQQPEPAALAAEVIAHMRHEPYSRVVTSEAVGASELQGVLSPAVSRLDSGRLGLVTYARTCPINGRPVPHLVVQGADGPVTLLLMPGEKIEAPVPLEGNGFHGVILPVGDGSIAVIGEEGRSVEDVAEGVREAVDWRI